MEKEYLVLDFGNVIAKPAMENWFVTPNFWNVVSKDKVNMEKLNQAIKKHGHFLGNKMCNEADEYYNFFQFYEHILTELKIDFNDDMIEAITDDWTYNDNKFKFYENIIKELEYLKQKYKLLMLSDNWPSVLRIMNNLNLNSYFEKIYISSYYEATKLDGKFFKYPIDEYNLQGNTFVDDDINNLDKAYEMGLNPVLMNRDNVKVKKKYKSIDSLFDL